MRRVKNDVIGRRAEYTDRALPVIHRERSERVNIGICKKHGLLRSLLFNASTLYMASAYITCIPRVPLPPPTPTAPEHSLQESISSLPHSLQPAQYSQTLHQHDRPQPHHARLQSGPFHLPRRGRLFPRHVDIRVLSRRANLPLYGPCQLEADLPCAQQAESAEYARGADELWRVGADAEV